MIKQLRYLPKIKNSQERLAQFPDSEPWPVKKDINIYWHPHMIPFIEAQEDEDCAFAIGVCHAHLRLGQMELMRRISAGRMAEIGGPLYLPAIDSIIRTLNLQKSARQSLTLFSPTQKDWLKAYVRGVNYFINHTTELPLEFRLLNLKKEHWTCLDAIRSSRLAAADILWSNYFSFLSLKKEQGWQDLWDKFSQHGHRSLASFVPEEKMGFASILSRVTRSGSNSLVLGKTRTKKKGALIANDPHLGIILPNLWLLMGYKCPSYHVLGYMFPVAPAVTIGRNKHIAWGGTYMRSISSYLFELSPNEKITTRNEKIKIRGWLDKNLPFRESAKGPIISDLPQFKHIKKNIALSWAGHQPSNELGAFLGAARARNWTQFRDSFKDFSVAGLNLTYADCHGNIGMILATKQPLLKNQEEQYNLVKSPDNNIIGYKGPLDLPQIFNPKKDFIASANNTPVRISPPLAYVSGQNDRILRLHQLVGSKKNIDIANLMHWQQDVFSRESLELKELIQNFMSPPHKKDLRVYWTCFCSWDGHFRAEDRGPVAFELLCFKLAHNILAKEIPSKKLRNKIIASESWKYFLYEKLNLLSAAQKKLHIYHALEDTLKYFQKYLTWGDMHIQQLKSPLGLLPFLGNNFCLNKYPAPGGSTTLNKSAYNPGLSQRKVNFGAQSRHISDLSDPNENYFIMLGGNDGWLNNQHLADQSDLWRKGQYIKIPLELYLVKKAFSLHISKIKTKI